MRRIFLIPCVFFALLTAANAGEMYRCIDREGNIIISDYQRVGMKCELRGSYRDPSPQERTQEQEEAQKISVQQGNQEAQRIQGEEKELIKAEAEKQRKKAEEEKAQEKVEEPK
jgi:hypothetical protein